MEPTTLKEIFSATSDFQTFLYIGALDRRHCWRPASDPQFVPYPHSFNNEIFN